MNSKIGIISILTALTLAAILATGLTIPAYAEPNNPTADGNVHDNTPGELGGEQDVRYHEGTCHAGSDHPVCDDESIISEPGRSDNQRRDN